MGFILQSKEAGVKDMIMSLGLLCTVSLLLALLSLVFLLKVSPVRREKLLEYAGVYEVTLALGALSLSLDICCLLVCAIQFVFAVKLVRAAHGRARTIKYLKEASITRTCAITGFFVSIPVFLTGLILYTFLHFESTPAIVTSVVIGLGIVFCGGAVVHNVFVWQREKSKVIGPGNGETAKHGRTILLGTELEKSGLPQATVDLSNGANATVISAKGLELSTLV